jgi:hypothetical protein
VEIQEYQNQVTVPVPPHMETYRLARVRAGLTPIISVDRCVLGELITLWRKGVRTGGSCCGHNRLPSMINALTPEDGALMEAMGYVRWPEKPGMWPFTYFAKSVPGKVE